MIWKYFYLKNRSKILEAARSGEINNILLVRCQKIGDMLTFLPAVLEVHRLFGSAHITLACKKEALEVVQRIPFVEIVLIDDLVRNKKKFMSSYDLIITSAADAGKIKLKKQLNIKYAVGALPESLEGVCLKHRWQYRYFDSVEVYKESEHDVYRNLNILKLLGYSGHSQYDRSLWIRQSELERVAAILPETTQPLILISATGSRRNKNWSPDLLAELCDKLVRELHATIVFVGKGSFANEQTRRILELMKESAVSLVDKTALGELSALIGKAKLMISVDTGTAHLSSYSNSPLIVLFGPGDIKRWGPWHRDENLGVALSAPCKCKTTLPECLEKKHCLDSIMPGQVFEAAVKLLKGHERE